ncbi:MAG: zonular occludens toxin domain-containing protein [Dietzia sp.]|nr:zonular occludens toxin domain-containing protein [Dietzia sp.]
MGAGGRLGGVHGAGQRAVGRRVVIALDLGQISGAVNPKVAMILGAALLGGYLLMMRLFKWSARLALGGKLLEEGKVRGVIGLMGHGKSTLAALHIVRPWLARGRTIVANFGIEPDAQGLSGTVVFLTSATFLEDLLEIGTDGTFVSTLCSCSKNGGCVDHPDHPVPTGCARCKKWLRCPCNGVKVVIDEAQVFIPANNSKSLPIELKSWITLMRKNHIELTWLAQSHKDVHAMLRRMTSEMWKCNKDFGVGLVAQRYACEAGEPGQEPTETIKYMWSPKADGMFNSWEIIIPARDALEMAGKLSKKYVDRLQATQDRRRGGGVADEVGATTPAAPVEVAEPW